MKLVLCISILVIYCEALLVRKKRRKNNPNKRPVVRTIRQGSLFFRGAVGINPTSTKQPTATTGPVKIDGPKTFFLRFAPSNSGNKFLTASEIKDLGISALAKQLGLLKSDLFVTSRYVDFVGVTHIYCKRRSQGVDVRFQESAVHILNGEVIAMSGTANAPIVKDDMSSRPLISAESASSIASSTYGIPAVGTPRLLYMQIYEDSDDYEHIYEIELLDASAGKHMMVLVNARDGTIVNTNSFIKSYSYDAIALPNTSPTAGGFQRIDNPEYTASSPNGWAANFVTSGNNAKVE